MGKKISQLDAVTSNTVDDLVECVQSGTSKKTTVQKILDTIATVVGVKRFNPDVLQVREVTNGQVASLSYEDGVSDDTKIKIPLGVLNGGSGDIEGTLQYVENMSNDTALSDNSASKYPTQHAVKTYADSLVVGLLDDRGNYNASGNVFPSTGGSGTSGAIKKGDLWFISVAGTLGGVSVAVGSSLRALVDTPGQTSGNWSIFNVGLGYTPENVVNKSTDITADTGSNIKYPSVKAVQDYIGLTKVIKGYFNQPGTSIPSVTAVKNDLSGAIVWTRNAAGSYTGTLNGAFPSGKTFIASKSQTNIEANRELTIFSIDANNINVYCRKTTDSTLVDLDLTNDSFVINIEVYP